MLDVFYLAVYAGAKHNAKHNVELEHSAENKHKKAGKKHEAKHECQCSKKEISHWKKLHDFFKKHIEKKEGEEKAEFESAIKKLKEDIHSAKKALVEFAEKHGFAKEDGEKIKKSLEERSKHHHSED